MLEDKILKEPLFWLSMILILLCGALFKLPDNQLHVIFCDVGQGDGILIVYRQTQILIDGGPDQKVLQCLDKNVPFYDRQIEMVVLTHPEKDHETGLIDVLKRYNVIFFVSNGLSNSSATFKELAKTKQKEKVLSVVTKTGDQIRIGSLHFSVLWPPKDYSTKEINDSSVVLELSFGRFNVLLTGDISEKIEKVLSPGEVEILKVAHHGSKFSTSEEFLTQAKPQAAVISVGKNSFGHPTQEVLERLNKAGIKILRTDQIGEIQIVSNGDRWYNLP